MAQPGFSKRFETQSCNREQIISHFYHVFHSTRYCAIQYFEQKAKFYNNQEKKMKEHKTIRIALHKWVKTQVRWKMVSTLKERFKHFRGYRNCFLKTIFFVLCDGQRMNWLLLCNEIVKKEKMLLHTDWQKGATLKQ